MQVLSARGDSVCGRRCATRGGVGRGGLRGRVAARGMTTERQMEVRKPSTRENTGGGERTRTAYFHVANVFEADRGGFR